MGLCTKTKRTFNTTRASHPRFSFPFAGIILITDWTYDSNEFSGATMFPSLLPPPGAADCHLSCFAILPSPTSHFQDNRTGGSSRGIQLPPLCIKSFHFHDNNGTDLGKSLPQLTTVLKFARCCSRRSRYCFIIRMICGNGRWL